MRHNLPLNQPMLSIGVIVSQWGTVSEAIVLMNSKIEEVKTKQNRETQDAN